MCVWKAFHVIHRPIAIDLPFDLKDARAYFHHLINCWNDLIELLNTLNRRIFMIFIRFIAVILPMRALKQRNYQNGTHNSQHPNGIYIKQNLQEENLCLPMALKKSK